MSIRECSYTTSNAVKKNIPEATVDEMIRRVVDEAYDKNMVLRKNTYAKRFQIWTVKGKIANGEELLDAIHHHPQQVGYLLPIVYLWEVNGEDHLFVALHSEILENPDLMLCPEITDLAKKPPNITVESMIEIARTKG